MPSPESHQLHACACESLRRTFYSQYSCMLSPARSTGAQISFMSSPGQVRTLKRQRVRFFGTQGFLVETITSVEDRIPLSDNFHVEDRCARLRRGRFSRPRQSSCHVHGTWRVLRLARQVVRRLCVYGSPGRLSGLVNDEVAGASNCTTSQAWGRCRPKAAHARPGNLNVGRKPPLHGNRVVPLTTVVATEATRACFGGPHHALQS